MVTMLPKYDIYGQDLQYLTVELNPREKVYGEAGHLIMKSASLKMDTKLKGGILSSLKRELTGASFFVIELEGPGSAVFSGIFPGKIIKVPMGNKGLLAQAHSFLMAEDSVKYDAKLARFSVGFLGGQGILFARFLGSGNVFLHSHGNLISKDLSNGETIEVESSHLMAFEDGMEYSITRVGGIRSMLFSGEGLFFVKIKGPGRVYLHTLTVTQLANAIGLYLKG